MDELTGQIGLTLPTEARAWWSWHDGVEHGVIVPQPGIGDGWVPLSLAEAVEDGTWHIDPNTGDFAVLDPTELLHAKGPDVADLL
jgi:hypothetical protein